MSAEPFSITRSSGDSWENAVRDAFKSDELLEYEKVVVQRYGTDTRHKFRVDLDVTSEAHGSPWHIPMFRAVVTYVGPDQD